MDDNLYGVLYLHKCQGSQSVSHLKTREKELDPSNLLFGIETTNISFLWRPELAKNKKKKRRRKSHPIHDVLFVCFLLPSISWFNQIDSIYKQLDSR